MVRLAALLLLAAAPAAAADRAPVQYRAQLAAASAPERLIVRDLVWHCEAGACVAPRSNSRPEVICGALAREAGTLRSFSVDGRELDAGQLEKCNARAR